MTYDHLLQKRAEELQEDVGVLESYIQSFWKVLPIPVCSTNPIFTILETGDTFNFLFEYAKDEIVGEALKILFVSEQFFSQLTNQLVGKGEIFGFETVVRSKSGREIIVSVSAIARRDEDGEVVGYIFSLVDITETKKFEKQLTEQIQNLEKFQRLTVGREIKMIELKREISKLQKRGSKSPKVSARRPIKRKL
ncbi:MAG: hypothetical protein A2445_03385 [Candidatus Jacksonbacteria bacterium RIFOXYC2_FULL_44_29]|nr:MAG: hypothetical protein UW45_C0035G0016 [Parcubacteria group bacterium GW2011_GWC2_44_22]OGY76490.1 MAG: hypothetical protein A2240_04485 [Candidatus Jacksonbacteria bacterium RIFOXYA2_FULL_43_12]OGY77280.1 MAG: hypothetical protein A2295_04980 [Candidatus Jacksonbacteria bacterium RIFOXYB2_FULL_44_15]OGY78263.1 MAG: hypothetical protein A2445_03385 [Candidatus Jacksonbacteria bacterium RIFOXYC2_FULL_44_29]OGY78914.1 MAG: hypothetical protein A2550_05250 [Candidatus Jacksonbacteria bacteri